jgi:hypothetical protein
MARGLYLALLALAASAQPAASDALLERVLLDGGDLGTAWDIVEEAPTDAGADPDLHSWGVRHVRARHYTRGSAATAQVCSIEVWAFESVAQARVAQQNLSYPQWQITREGSLLFLVHALTRSPGNPPRRAVFTDCEDLAERTRARASTFTPSD